MSGKQHKRELRRQREAARAAARLQDRRKTIQTMIVIAVVVTIGGVLVFVSVDRPISVGQAVAGTIPAIVRSDAPVACGATEPANAAAPRPTFPGGPTQALEPGVDYRAMIQTSCGQVVVDLAEQASPVAANSFAFLARQQFFDGLEIFRNATTIGALQTGSGTNEATWDTGYTIPDELSSAALESYPPGAVALANGGPNTSGSQFFFVYNDKFQLPPNYTKFGRVVEGLEVLQRIGAIPTSGAQGETPNERIYIESVTIESLPASGSQ
ncbi:MAG: peptidylprolyl isomerase [Egibacteraceae bacterium]